MFAIVYSFHVLGAIFEWKVGLCAVVFTHARGLACRNHREALLINFPKQTKKPLVTSMPPYP